MSGVSWQEQGATHCSTVPKLQGSLGPAQGAMPEKMQENTMLIGGNQSGFSYRHCSLFFLVFSAPGTAGLALSVGPRPHLFHLPYGLLPGACWTNKSRGITAGGSPPPPCLHANAGFTCLQKIGCDSEATYVGSRWTRASSWDCLTA